MMNSLSDEEIFAEYSYTPYRMSTGMVDIRDEDAPQPTCRKAWTGTARGVGRFNALPVEILHLILENLNFLSLSRFSRVSRRGHELIAALPSYQNLVRHAPKTLAALSKMAILHLHSSSALHKALYADQYACCGNFGAFLFLIACQRCCFECLSTKQALWVMPRSEAAKCFDIPAKELKLLPVARSVPGKYSVLHGIVRTRPQRLVSVSAAKDLALRLHGGTEASLAAHLQSRPPQTSSCVQGRFAHLRRARLVFESHDPRLILPLANTADDSCDGMASIPFPALRQHSNVVDHGSWCRGCQWVWRHVHTLPDEILFTSLVPPRHNPSTYRHSVALREWSDSNFIEHARSCYGLQNMAESIPSKFDDIMGI